MDTARQIIAEHMLMQMNPTVAGDVEMCTGATETQATQHGAAGGDALWRRPWRAHGIRRAP